jgi:hypothetical protein
MIGAGAVTIASGAELQIARSDDITLFNTISGAGKITLGGAGKVTLDSTASININGELKFGTSAGSVIHSTLDLTNASISVGTFKVQTDATANTALYDAIIIGTGKSLTVSGLTTIGLDNTSNPTTNLTISGSGTFNIGSSALPTNSNVNVGASITPSKINYVNWDMSALNTLNMYLGTGTFNIGADLNTTGGTGGSGNGVTVKLGINSTIVGSAILMDAVDGSKTFTLSLGSGSNIINVDTLTVSGPNTRASSVLNFNTSDGSVVIRNKLGTDRFTLNVQSSTNASGNNQEGTFDVSGHSADLLLSTVNIGQRVNLTGAAGVGYGLGYLAFDKGTFNATTLNIGNKSHNGTGLDPLKTATKSAKTIFTPLSANVLGLASFGGGTVTLGSVDVGRHGASNVGGTVQGLIEFLGSNTSTVGAVTMATSAAPLISGSVVTTGWLSVADGFVTVSSITGASTAANTSATANVNVSGGTLKLGGNIIRTGGAGSSVFNINLSGGTLDMNANQIGSSTAAVTFNWTGGTLKNVSGLNGTSGIIVNSGNQFVPVYLDGTNTFASAITIKDSILQLVSSTALGAEQ